MVGGGVTIPSGIARLASTLAPPSVAERTIRFPQVFEVALIPLCPQFRLYE